MNNNNKIENKMGPELLNTILFIKSAIKGMDENCRSKRVTNDLIELHNVSMYAFKNVLNK